MDVELVRLVLLLDEVEPELIDFPGGNKYFKIFFFLLEDVELVVDAVPIRIHRHLLVSIYQLTEVVSRNLREPNNNP